MIDIERLRALEKNWKALADYAADDKWDEGYISAMNSAADDLSRLIAELGQEVAPVAFDDDKLLELLRKHFLKSGHRNRDAYEAMTYEKSPEMFPQATYDVPTCAVTSFVQDCVAAFASTAHTSEARDAGAKLDEVSAYVIELANECDDLYDKAMADGDQDWANAQVARLTAINQIGLKIGCIQFNDAAMRQEGGDGA